MWLPFYQVVARCMHVVLFRSHIQTVLFMSNVQGYIIKASSDKCAVRRASLAFATMPKVSSAF